MFVFDEAALCRNAMRLYLEGKPTGSLAEWAAASKVVDLAAGCRRFATGGAGHDQQRALPDVG
jgi:hypothetical protein